jgi:hypothetical protein
MCYDVQNVFTVLARQSVTILNPPSHANNVQAGPGASSYTISASMHHVIYLYVHVVQVHLDLPSRTNMMAATFSSTKTRGCFLVRYSMMP